MSETRPGELSLFFHRVGALVKRPVVTCARGVSAVDVARRLSTEGVGSVVVLDDAGVPVGIVTDRDLRRKLVAEGRDPAATPVEAIMSSPLVTLSPGAFAFEAVLEMTRHRIRHVVLLENGRAVGVVSSRDFLLLQSTHPVTLAREVARAPSVEALAALGTQLTELVRRLARDGGTPYDIGKIVAELNDRVVIRVLALTRSALVDAGAGEPPVPYCWLALGADGRRERTLRTGQRNGLVYRDAPAEGAASAAAYYARFGEAAIRALVRIGFPPCPDGVMASNPRWCQPLSAWTGHVDAWVRGRGPDDARVLAPCLDLRPIAGELALGDALRALVRRQAPGGRAFLAALARDVVERRLPLTILGNVAVLRDGPHRGALDVESAGAGQLVGAARVHALALGLTDGNTVDRFHAVAAGGVLSAAEAAEIVEAYQHLLRLRLVHQLGQLGRGEPPDTYVRPGQLARADALLMRDAMRVAAGVQRALRRRFAAGVAR